MAERTRASKPLTPRQRVLRKRPRAFLKWHWPNCWFVFSHRKAEDSIASAGRTPSDAWKKAARILHV